MKRVQTPTELTEQARAEIADTALWMAKYVLSGYGRTGDVGVCILGKNPEMLNAGTEAVTLLRAAGWDARVRRRWVWGPTLELLGPKTNA